MQGSTGVKVKITTTGLTAIANILDVQFPPQIKELADMTSHPTTGTTTWRQYIDTGIRELGEFPMTLGWDISQTEHAAILTAFNGTTAVNMSIEDPAGDEVIAFAGFIRQIARMAPTADGFKCDVIVRPTGAPTIT